MDTQTMVDRKKLLLAESLIEQGEVKKAKQVLLEIIDNSGEDDDIEVVIKNANTILALEIIEQVIKKDPAAVEEFKKELSTRKEAYPCEISSKLEEMIAKGLL